jgi:hypothetical protein
VNLGDIEPADERPHVAPEPCPRWWSETWAFDFGNRRRDRGDSDDMVGGYVWFTVLPAQRRCWYWSAVVRSGERLISLVDLDVAMSRSVMEIRSSGLWAMHVCEEPLARWTVGSEAFGVALDDPADALGDAYGEVVPIGFDLEWEAAGVLTRHNAVGTVAYRVDATVHGEVLVGDDRLAISDASGRWMHRWGEHDWTQVADSDDTTDAVPRLDGLHAPIRLDVDGVVVNMHAMLGDGLWRYAFAARR